MCEDRGSGAEYQYGGTDRRKGGFFMFTPSHAKPKLMKGTCTFIAGSPISRSNPWWVPLIVTLKYIFVLLRADFNGEDGKLAGIRSGC